MSDDKLFKFALGDSLGVDLFGTLFVTISQLKKLESLSSNGGRDKHEYDFDFKN